MPRQRQLTIPQSIRISQVWYSLLRENGTLWDFWGVDPVVLTQMCTNHNVEELIDWPAPYERTWAHLKTLLKVISSYMSRGNFEAGLNEWINRPIVPAQDGDEPGGGLGGQRDGLVQGTPGSEGSSVGAMTIRCKEMLLTIEYVDLKFSLGEVFVENYNTYKELKQETIGLDNRVLRLEETKASALDDLNKVFEAQDQAFRSIKSFFSREPGEGAYNGTLFMFGDNFNNGVGIADLDALVIEAGGRQTQAVMRVSPNIEVMADVPELLDQHDQLIALYNTISNQRVEREEQTRDVSRRTRILMTELNTVRREIENTSDEEFTGSVT